MEDREIVALYWNREETAIAETSRKYGAYLSKIAWNVLSNNEDSEECVNDTLLKTWNSIPTHRPAVLSTYLGRIVRQLAVDIYRKRHAKKRYASEFALSLSELDDTFAGGDSPEQAMDASALRDALNRFLEALSPTARSIFVGRYYFFDPVSRIAQYCGVAEGTVKSSLHRTRQSLKEFLTKEGFSI